MVFSLNQWFATFLCGPVNVEKMLCGPVNVNIRCGPTIIYIYAYRFDMISSVDLSKCPGLCLEMTQCPQTFNKEYLETAGKLVIRS